MADNYTTPEFIGVALASIVMLTMYLKKFSNSWTKTDAESTIVTMMRQELERMAAQNTALQVELNKLQTDVLSLNQELRNLTIENQKLHAEVAALTSEITRLQLLLNTTPKLKE